MPQLEPLLIFFIHATLLVGQGLLDKPCRRKILADGLSKMGVWTHQNWTDKNRNRSGKIAIRVTCLHSKNLFNRKWSCFLQIQKRNTRNKNSQLQHETNHHWRIAKTATSPLQNCQDRGNPGGTPPKQSTKSKVVCGHHWNPKSLKWTHLEGFLQVILQFVELIGHLFKGNQWWKGIMTVRLHQHLEVYLT